MFKLKKKTKKSYGIPFVFQGDSGGPLVVRNPRNEFCQAGVVSFFVPNRATSQPSGFGRVSAVRSWIRDVAGI